MSRHGRRSTAAERRRVRTRRQQRSRQALALLIARARSVVAEPWHPSRTILLGVAELRVALAYEAAGDLHRAGVWLHQTFGAGRLPSSGVYEDGAQLAARLRAAGIDVPNV